MNDRFAPLGRRTLLTGASALALTAGLPILPAAAQSGDPTGRSPANTAGAPGGQPLITPEDVRSNPQTRLLEVVVNAAYATYDLAGLPVTLRSYDGGPRPRTLRFKAGDTVSLALKNTLPKPLKAVGDTGGVTTVAATLPAATPPAGTAAGGHGHHHAVAGPTVPGQSGINVPHDFNTTNMHVHGLHISPRSPADNVLVSVDPGLTGNYVYPVRPNHPCGLNFYHAHEHGSVALQVASGMAGALIVEGKVDEIEAIRDAKDVVMLLQSLQVDQDGRLEHYATLDGGTQVYINGQKNPTISMQQGEVQRWRLVNATHNRFLTLRLAEHGFVALGFDGNPLETTERMDAIFLAPGNRAELLVKAIDRPGTYALDGGSNFGMTYGTIATVSVQATAVTMPLHEGSLVSYAGDFDGHLKPIGDEEIVKGRRVGFGQVGTLPYWTWTIDGEPFATDEKGFDAKLGTAEEWVLTNQTNDPHPFHIHINPFQVMETSGLPVEVPAGRWLDTITIPPNGHVRLRTRYLDYDGVYVFHCHTLVHEDQGMMRLFTVQA